MCKKLLPVLILLVALVFSACNPFTTNIYQAIDQYEPPDYGDADALYEARDEPQFFKNLKDDPKAKAKVLETLSDVYNDPDASDEDIQDAALLAMDVHLKTSDTDDSMSNFNSLVGDAVSGETVYSEDEGPEVFFRKIFGEPPSSSYKESYKEDVEIQLEAFLSAVEPMEAYGKTREEGAPIPYYLNVGDTATKALMAGMTRTIVYYLGGTDPVDTLAIYLATPKDADGNLPPELDYEQEVPDFDNPTEMLHHPETGTTYLKTVADDGLDLDALFD